MKSLSDHLAVVTGAATGLGRALAIEAAARGAVVVIADISDCSETADAIRSAGGTAHGHIVDVSDYEAMATFADRVRKRHGVASILINNAAAGGGAGPLNVADPSEVKRMFAVNILGVFNGIHAFSPMLLQTAANGGPAFIMNVGSEHSLGVPPHVPPVSAYTASKYAILGLTETAQRDFGGKGIHVSLLAPGWILTDKIRAWMASSSEWRKLIGPYAQEPREVACKAFDGLLARRNIIPTNPSSREFAIEHARDVMEAAQQLPKTSPPLSHGHGFSGVCPFSGGAGRAS